MLAKVQKLISDFIAKHDLEFMLIHTNSHSIQFYNDQYGDRFFQNDADSFSLKLFNKDNQKATLNFGPEDFENISTLLERSTSLFQYSPKKYSLNKISNQKISHISHKLGDFDQVIKEVRSYLEEQRCIQEARINKLSIEHFILDKSEQKVTYLSSDGTQAEEIFNPSYSFFAKTLVKKDTSIDDHYISAEFYNFSQTEKNIIDLEMRKAADKVITPDAEMIEAKGEVLLEPECVVQLFELISEHLDCTTIKENRSLIFKDNKYIDFSNKINLYHTTKTDSPYDHVLNSSGEARQDIYIIKNGKVENIFTDINQQQKYGETSNGLDSVSTLELQGRDSINRDDYNIIISYLSGAHNVNEVTLDINLTANGFIKKNGVLTYSKAIHLTCNLIDLFQNHITKIGDTTERNGSYLVPAIEIKL